MVLGLYNPLVIKLVETIIELLMVEYSNGI